LSEAEWIPLSIAGFFAVLALLVFLRLLLRKGPPDWVEYRVGVYVERKPEKTEVQSRTSPTLPPSSQE